MESFDWKNIFLNDLDLSIAVEIGIRTIIMFALVLIFLRSTGKKGVRQLSIFEVAIIIALGSAAGDPMLNGESAIIPSVLVFLVILLVYRIITFFAAKYQKVENILEGVPMYIVEDGRFTMNEEGDANFAQDEFFAEMRVQGIEHVGQVRTALLETNGQVSFLFFDDEAVQPGLPIYPKLYNKKAKAIPEPGLYACTHCAEVLQLAQQQACSRCNKEEWVAAISDKRIK
ncbi:DUF421 domain-containing protein [uncultured Pedobacter sp.]|uniref:DUF421 domain-containing protein n=1 Tax=uncultured Pedobacter sp. TaxID=246139 RepID=UPI0025EDA4F5|nr:YetF domain-containing protein [uncultured Pedobacter sp.]